MGVTAGEGGREGFRMRNRSPQLMVDPPSGGFGGGGRGGGGPDGERTEAGKLSPGREGG